MKDKNQNQIVEANKKVSSVEWLDVNEFKQLITWLVECNKTFGQSIAGKH